MENLEISAQRILALLNEEAPKMSLRKAYTLAEEHQKMRDDLGKYEFIIMMLLKALSFNDNGYMRDPDIAKKLKDMPDEVWAAIKLSLNVHAGYSCSPFTPTDWVEKRLRKMNVNLPEVRTYKDEQLALILKEE